MALSEKRQRFVDEYLIDLCATQAAIRAGYSANGAGTEGSRLLQNAEIRARIDERLAEHSRRTGINQERVLRELARVAFLDPTKLADFDAATIRVDATEDDTAAIATVKVKRFPTADGEGVEREIRFADKLKALELLGKYFAMFTDKTQTDLTARVEIVDDVPEGN